MNVDIEVVRMREWIYSRALRYCHGEDAKDLAEETICKILSSRERYDESKPFKPWCETIMRNTYITQYNRYSLFSYSDYDSVKDSVSYSHANDSADIHAMLSVIRRCASRSSSIECVIYYAKGYSYDEIADRLNIPVGTVRSRISNGREMIRRELEIKS